MDSPDILETLGTQVQVAGRGQEEENTEKKMSNTDSAHKKAKTGVNLCGREE